MGRGILIRGPAGVGALADWAGTRPLVVGASPLHKSALLRSRGQKEGPRPGGAGGLGRRWADPGFVERASRPGLLAPNPNGRTPRRPGHHKPPNPPLFRRGRPGGFPGRRAPSGPGDGRGWPCAAGPRRHRWAVAAVAVAVWWPPTLPLGRERPAGPPGSRQGVPSPVDPFGPRHSFGASRPADSDSPLRGGLLPVVGGEPEARPSPQVVPRPALGVEAPRVPVQAFGSRSQEDAPSDTTGHQVPRWEPEGTPTRLVSPSGAAAYVPEPSGFPRTAQVSPAYTTAIVRVPHPSGPHAQRFPR